MGEVMRIRTVRLDGQDLPVIKIRFSGKRAYLCQRCGTWKCTRCGHKRVRANRNYPGVLSCPRCGCMTGTWTATYHDDTRYFLCNDEEPPRG